MLVLVLISYNQEQADFIRLCYTNMRNLLSFMFETLEMFGSSALSVLRNDNKHPKNRVKPSIFLGKTGKTWQTNCKNCRFSPVFPWSLAAFVSSAASRLGPFACVASWPRASPMASCGRATSPGPGPGPPPQRC